jgi:hypothetical protein
MGVSFMRRLLGTLAIIVIIVVVVGVYRDWFHFTRSQDQGGETLDLGVQVDKQKIKEDQQALENKAKEFGGQLRDKAAPEEKATGTIAQVDPTAQRVVVRTTDQKEITVYLESATKVRLNDAQASLKEVHEGDRATVNYSAKDGKNYARSISVERAG